MQAHEDFALAYVECDPNLLWAIILYTHLTHVGGHGPELALLTLDDALSKYESIRQGSRESIGDFLSRFKHGNSTLTSAGVESRIDAVVAVQFLKKLDSNRHGHMFAEMKNLAQRGIPLPQTLAEAYIAASTYVVKRSAGNYEVEDHSICWPWRWPRRS